MATLQKGEPAPMMPLPEFIWLPGSGAACHIDPALVTSGQRRVVRFEFSGALRGMKPGIRTPDRIGARLSLLSGLLAGRQSRIVGGRVEEVESSVFGVVGVGEGVGLIK